MKEGAQNEDGWTFSYFHKCLWVGTRTILQDSVRKRQLSHFGSALFNVKII